MSADRLEQLNESTLVYHLRKPTLDGHTELILKPVELLERLSKLITPPRIHKHRYCGVLAPNARLRRAVVASAGPAAATQQQLELATDKMSLSAHNAESSSDTPSAWRRTAAHCWALLLVRIYECLPLICPRCGEAMRIVAFIQEPEVIERILCHIREPPEVPQVRPARARRSICWSSATAPMSTSGPTSIRQPATAMTSWNEAWINGQAPATHAVLGEVRSSLRWIDEIQVENAEMDRVLAW